MYLFIIYLLFITNIFADVNLYTYDSDTYITVNNNIVRESLNSTYFAFDSKYTFQLPKETQTITQLQKLNTKLLLDTYNEKKKSIKNEKIND